MRMWSNNISCFAVQNTWITTRINSLPRLARLLPLAKEAENANSHNSIFCLYVVCTHTQLRVHTELAWHQTVTKGFFFRTEPIVGTFLPIDDCHSIDSPLPIHQVDRQAFEVRADAWR